MKNHERKLSAKLCSWLSSLSNETTLAAGTNTSCFCKDGTTLNKTKLTEIVAREICARPLGAIFCRELMNHNSFRGWFCLSAHNEPVNKLFQNFACANDTATNQECQHVIRKYFSIMEDACQNHIISFERGWYDYLLSDSFKELHGQCLPENLRGCPPGTIYLAEALKYLFGEVVI